MDHMQLQQGRRKAESYRQGSTVLNGQSHPTMLHRPSKRAAMYATLRFTPDAQ